VMGDGPYYRLPYVAIMLLLVGPLSSDVRPSC
jgi:hypothetical protein